jgi:anti-sigma-K factor RskA
VRTARSDDDAVTARSYLVGALPADDRLAFEVRLVEDPALYELVSAIEGELLHEHVEGTLAVDARARLEARLARDPRLRERRLLAAALTQIVARRALPATGRRRRWWLAIPALVATCTALWIIAQPRPGGTGERDLLVELPPTTRSNTIIEVAVPLDARRLRLELALYPASSPASGLRADVQGPTGAVPVTIVPDGSRLTLVLDAGALTPGLYDVTVMNGAEVMQTSQLRIHR